MKEKPRVVAIYARVSTKKGQSPDMQLRELRAYCKRRSWMVGGEYVDHGVSGTKDSRPALDRLMHDCKRRLVSAVIVYRYDRFARSLSHLVRALSEFDNLGIDFISLHEGVDTSSANGRLVFGIFASIADFERRLIVDRIKSGIAAAKAKGKVLGRPRTLKLSETQVTALKRERAKGTSTLRQLAREYDISLWRAHLLCFGRKARV